MDCFSSLSPIDIQKRIRQATNEFKHHIEYASFIGSANWVKNTRLESDFDLLILIRNHDHYKEIIKSIVEIFNHEIYVVNSWGIVTREYLKNDVLHLLIDTADNFVSRPTLFRRSISKYKPFIGNGTVLNTPSSKIDINELLFDKNGIIHLRNSILKNNFTSGNWIKIQREYKYIEVPNCYSSEADQIFYVLFHSIRNYLRFKDKIIEFEEILDLIFMDEFLIQNKNEIYWFVNEKKRRKKLKISPLELKPRAISFLDNLIEHLKAHSHSSSYYRRLQLQRP